MIFNDTEYFTYFARSFARSSVNNYNLTNSNAGMHLVCRESSVNDIWSAMKQVRPNFTMSQDIMAAFLIHECAHVLSWAFTILFNLYLPNNIFPFILKQ